MDKKLISIIIIGYNSRKFLQTCFDAIFAQTYFSKTDSSQQDASLELIFIDNNSTDDSVAWTRETYGTHKNLTVIKNPENIGYTGAANQGIEMSKGEYVVITNPDIIYTPEYFERAVAFMEEHADVAALTGKVVKYDFDATSTTSTTLPPEAQKIASIGAPTSLIDTVGLAIFRSRRVIDDGQGLPDDGRFDKDAQATADGTPGHQVFGISGACPLYRRSALNDAKLTQDVAKGNAATTTTTVAPNAQPVAPALEILDNTFFMYKEDVDLSWRLTLLGWKCWYLPTAIAYHGRGTGVAQRFTTEQVLQQRSGLSQFQKHYSFCNQRLMQVKNELAQNFLHDILWILAREIGSLVYITFKEPATWKAVWRFFTLLPAALRKRRELMTKVEAHWRDKGGIKAAAQYMQQWFVERSRYVKIDENSQK